MTRNRKLGLLLIAAAIFFIALAIVLVNPGDDQAASLWRTVVAVGLGAGCLSSGSILLIRG